MAFENWFDPETIAAISAAVATVLGAVGVLIARVKKEGIQKMFQEGLRREAEVAKEAIRAMEHVCEVKSNVDKRSEAKREGEKRNISSSKPKGS